jgi:hypothetical protein
VEPVKTNAFAAMTIALSSLFSSFLIPVRAASAPPGPHAVIDGGGLLLGGSERGRWLSDDVTAKRLRGGEAYRFYGFRRVCGTATGSRAAYDAHVGAWSVDFTSRAPDGAVIGVAGSWNALPRLPHEQSVSQPFYRNVVHNFLARRGLRDPRVKITRIVRCDLDGKGTDSVLIAAQANEAGSRGYSLVLARQVVGRTVRTSVLEESLNNRSDRYSTYDLAGLYDLRGDGRMEPVVTLHEIDSGGMEVFDLHAGRARRALFVEAGV